MNENKELYSPMVLFAWAVPICSLDPEGLVDPIVFEENLPEPPPNNINAIYTFMDGDGKILPHPGQLDRQLPPFCYVQYEGTLPPPPAGYHYIYSEFEYKVSSPEYKIYHEVGQPRYCIDTPNIGNYVPYTLTQLERSGMVSTLIEYPEGYFSTQAGALISNFIIKPHRLVRINTVNGVVSERLEYSIESDGKRISPICECEIEDLDRLPEKIRGMVTGSMINLHVQKVDAQIVFHIRSLLLKLPRVDKYEISGWSAINGSWIYVQDNHHITDSSLLFETGFHIAKNQELSSLDAMHSAMGMLSVSNQPSVIVPLVLYAHLGVLYTLFEQAGFPPRMLLYVNGKTGSLKTALCSLLFNLTGVQKNNIPATFRDTVASVEAKFAEYADKVLLLDDFSPATTAKTRADMNKLLEDVIRYYGDGKGRGRSNIAVTKSSTPVPRGLCCITGEDTGGSQSSLLRCLLIDVSNGTFNGERLAPYQRDPSLWTSHFNYFIEYVAGRFDFLVEDIRNNFSKLRNELRNCLTAGRTVDSAVLLCVTAQILLDYGVYIGWCSRDQSHRQYGVWRTAIVETARKSEITSAEQDPVRFYVSTLFESIDSGSEVIAPDKEHFLRDTSVLGYEKEDGTWHIWPDRAYGLVIKRSQAQRKMYSMSLPKTHAALGDAGVARVFYETRGDKKVPVYLNRESFGERPRMLVVDIEQARKYLDM